MARGTQGILIFFLLMYVAITGVYGQERTTDSILRRLRQQLLNGYDVNVRPVSHGGNRTDVEVGLTPVHITQLDENTGILSMEGWVAMVWQDDHLRWDPAKFSGLKILRLPCTDVWKPDLSVFEGRGSKINPWSLTNVIVNSTGNVWWVPSASFELICGPMDYSKYPEDIQKCTLTVGSWTNDANILDLKLTMKETSMEHVKAGANPNWELISANGERKVKFYDCCVEPYAIIIYNLRLKRLHVPFSSLCSVAGTVARVLALCMFWLSNGTRKMLLGCTSLLILTVVAAGITKSLPSSAAASSALYKVNSSLSLCACALIVEIIILAVSSFRLGSPEFLDSIHGSTICKLLNPCAREDAKENSSSDQKPNRWPLLATLLDRGVFVMFLVILLIA